MGTHMPYDITLPPGQFTAAAAMTVTGTVSTVFLYQMQLPLFIVSLSFFYSFRALCGLQGVMRP